jgi:SAM-dependent methyltransferase
MFRIFRYWLLRASEKYHESRYGIQTDGLLSTQQLGIASQDSLEYTAVPYRVLEKIFRTLAITGQYAEVFLDIGCGMGRPVAVASRYPFRRIIGVELSPRLCSVAEKNVSRIRSADGSAVSIVHADAATYQIPDDVTVMFFYNPFKGTTLRKVIENLTQSLLRKPRLVRIVYVNRVFFDQETSGLAWIRKRLSYAFFPNASWALYEADGEMLVENRTSQLPSSADLNHT